MTNPRGLLGPALSDAPLIIRVRTHGVRQMSDQKLGGFFRRTAEEATAPAAMPTSDIVGMPIVMPNLPEHQAPCSTGAAPSSALLQSAAQRSG